MTQDEIIRMAREAWGDGHEIFWFDDNGIERFAALVAAHEREKHNSPSWETVDDAIAAEREACAKVCEDLIAKGYQLEGELDLCASAIRARSKNGTA